MSALAVNRVRALLEIISDGPCLITMAGGQRHRGHIWRQNTSDEDGKGWGTEIVFIDEHDIEHVLEMLDVVEAVRIEPPPALLGALKARAYTR